MFRKSQPAPARDRSSDIEDAVRPYRALLEDLATIYPAIRSLSEYRPLWGPTPLYLQYRTHDIERAAEAIRVAANKKTTDALVREFRGGATRVTASTGGE